MSITHDRTKTIVRRHVAPGEAVPLHPEAVGFADHYDFDIEVPTAYRPTGKVTGRTWVEKGRTSIVRRTGNPFSVNAMSAISTKGRTHFMVFTRPSTPTSCAASWTGSQAISAARCTSSWTGTPHIARARFVSGSPITRWRSCSSRTSCPLLPLWTRYSPVWRYRHRPNMFMAATISFPASQGLDGSTVRSASVLNR